jgi:hypothetical protein
MGVVPVYSLPTSGHRAERARGLGYNERPDTGTALLAVCITYVIMLVSVQGKSLSGSKAELNVQGPD